MLSLICQKRSSSFSFSAFKETLKSKLLNVPETQNDKLINMRLLLIMKFLNLIGLHLKMKNEANLKSKSQRYKKFRKMFQNQSFLEIYVPLHFSQLLSSYEQKNHTTSRGLAFIKFVDEFLKTSHLLCKEIESESSIEILLSKMFPGLFSLFL